MNLVMQLQLDADLLAKAIGISTKEIINLFRFNGRLSSYLLAARVSKELKMKQLNFENAPAGLVDENNNYFLIRTMTKKSGINFAPQYMRGSGRHFDQIEFEDHIKKYEGFLIIDATLFPLIDVYLIKTTELKEMIINKEMPDGFITFNSFHHKANGGLGRLF